MAEAAWALIVAAGLMEPIWAVGMKKSDGFRNLPWGVVTVFFLLLSTYLLAVAVDKGLPVGSAYAVWTGIGAVGTLVAGIALFKERASKLRIFLIFLIIAGIVGVQLTAGG